MPTNGEVLVFSLSAAVKVSAIWTEVERLLINGEIKPKELGYFPKNGKETDIEPRFGVSVL